MTVYALTHGDMDVDTSIIDLFATYELANEALREECGDKEADGYFDAPFKGTFQVVPYRVIGAE